MCNNHYGLKSHRFMLFFNFRRIHKYLRHYYFLNGLCQLYLSSSTKTNLYRCTGNVSQVSHCHRFFRFSSWMTPDKDSRLSQFHTVSQVLNVQLFQPVLYALNIAWFLTHSYPGTQLWIMRLSYLCHRSPRFFPFFSLIFYILEHF